VHIVLWLLLEIPKLSFFLFATMADVPIVANAAAQLSLNEYEDVGGPFGRVARAAKRCELAMSLHNAGVVTEDEYGAHEGFLARLTAAATGVVAGGGAPDWFGPAHAAGLVVALAPVIQRLDNVDQRLDNLERSQANLEARQNNAVASDTTDPLLPILDAAGNAAPNFPRNLITLMNMNGGKMDIFLKHYAQPVAGTNDEKRQRIKKFIGIRV
jgi:hypothetical protein